MSATTTQHRREGVAVALPTVFRLPWQRLGLGVTLVIAAVLNFWQLSKEGYANTYYAAAVKSMLQSWHNFFFVSFDPGGFVTVDKPPLGFWIQTASAKLFGFHGWSILLPEALAGVLSVLVLYHLVRRVFNLTAGLIAAFALAVSPISVVTNRNNTIDSLLILTVLLAAWAVSKATETGRFRWLLLGMILVGLGFNIKMLQAYLVLPALMLVYLLGAPHRWPKRIGHLALATVVLLAVSLSWAVAVDLTPANARPYVGSTQNNSELSLALGYNGLQRLLGTSMPGAPGGNAAANADGRAATTGRAADSTTTLAGDSATGSVQTGTDGAAFPGGAGGPGGGGPGGIGENGPKSIVRLFDQELGGQIGWLLPLALLGLVGAGGWLFLHPTQRRYGSETAVLDHAPTLRARLAGPVSRFLRAPLDVQQQALVLWGTWTLTMVAFFSVAGFFHRYYLSMLAPGIAALVGIGIVALWQLYRRERWLGRRERWLGWLLPVALLGTAVVQAKILADYPTYARWLTPIIIGIAAIASIVLVVMRLRHLAFVRGRLATVAVTAALCALLIAPTAWAAISVADGGGGGLPSAGPTQQASGFPGDPPSGVALPPGADANARGTGGPGGFSDMQTNTALITYLEANRGSAKYLVAVPSSQSADAIILTTGEPVMAMGGFTGSDPILTAASVAQLVKDGTVRYFLLGGGGPGGGFGGSNSATTWVTSQCTAVSSSQYQSSTSASTAGGPFGAQQLYDCSSVATKG